MTRMKSNSFLRSAALLAALALAVPALAKPISKTIQISQKARFGKTELSAGEYRLLVDGSKVTVQKGKNQLAEAEGRWEDRANKSDYNSVLVGADGSVKEVRFAGEKRVLVLSE
jgi:mevalonate pyrophosphate decarboxylase